MLKQDVLNLSKQEALEIAEQWENDLGLVHLEPDCLRALCSCVGLSNKGSNVAMANRLIRALKR